MMKSALRINCILATVICLCSCGRESISTDVLVVGGGTAGSIAAVQSARAGASTVLVEAGGALGGTTTTGGVSFPGLFHAWGRQVIGGIGWELVSAAVEMDGGEMPDFTVPFGTDHPRHQIHINPNIYSMLAEEACLDAGVEIRYYEFPTAVRRVRGGWAVDLCGKGGTDICIRCRQLVDCTGNADVVAKAGFARLRGENTAAAGGKVRMQGNGSASGRERRQDASDGRIGARMHGNGRFASRSYGHRDDARMQGNGSASGRERRQDASDGRIGVRMQGNGSGTGSGDAGSSRQEQGNSSASGRGRRQAEMYSAETQPGSLIFQLGGYDLAAVNFAAVDSAMAQARADGRLQPEDCYTSAAFLLSDRPGLAVSHVLGADSSTSVAHSAANIAGRTSLLRLVRFLRTLPGLEGLTVTSMQSETAIRETYRIDGLYTITVDDYVSGRIFDDAVAYSFYPIDLHDAAGVEPRHLENGAVATIPFRAMIPRGSRNMLVAGRCVSSDRNANSALRVQASCMAMGQAAGAAAALCSRMGITPAELPADTLRTFLREHGAIIPER